MEKRFLKGSGIEVFNGNELIIKGGLEAKIAEITGYPGSPVAETFDVISYHTISLSFQHYKHPRPMGLPAIQYHRRTIRSVFCRSRYGICGWRI